MPILIKLIIGLLGLGALLVAMLAACQIGMDIRMIQQRGSVESLSLAEQASARANIAIAFWAFLIGWALTIIATAY